MLSSVRLLLKKENETLVTQLLEKTDALKA
jgi:Txe/YoeB family toxin of Txe-Axe toxin-antitoxin module